MSPFSHSYPSPHPEADAHLAVRREGLGGRGERRGAREVSLADASRRNAHTAAAQLSSEPLQPLVQVQRRRLARDRAPVLRPQIDAVQEAEASRHQVPVLGTGPYAPAHCQGHRPARAGLLVAGGDAVVEDAPVPGGGYPPPAGCRGQPETPGRSSPRRRRGQGRSPAGSGWPPPAAARSPSPGRDPPLSARCPPGREATEAVPLPAAAVATAAAHSHKRRGQGGPGSRTGRPDRN